MAFPASLRPALRGPTAPALLALVFLGLLGPVPAGAKEEAPEAGKPGVPDEALQEQINQAIDRGAAWLREKQGPSGSVGGVVARGQIHYEMGTTGLAGLALLAAGDRRGEKGQPATSVDKVLQYVAERDKLLGQSGSRSTYDTGILLMFLTEYYREKAEESAPKAGTRTAHRSGNPCNLPDDAKKWIQDLANWLVQVRKPQSTTWGYPAHRDDLSNTQYAFLGLRAARDCGAKIPTPLFLQAAQTMLARQEQDGPKVPRTVSSGSPTDRPYVFDAGDRARGWSYLPQLLAPPAPPPPPNAPGPAPGAAPAPAAAPPPQTYPATGSMTTAGIAVLAICHDALTRPERFDAYDAKTERSVERSVQDGFTWLDHNWAIDRNPGNNAPNWHFYYLYGLERACVFGGRELIGLHDWYLDGARYLVGVQQGDGHWATGAFGDGTYEPSDVVDTAWAILFLARATRPIEKKVPVVTPD